jgi:hypothetical protein
MSNVVVENKLTKVSEEIKRHFRHTCSGIFSDMVIQ